MQASVTLVKPYSSGFDVTSLNREFTSTRLMLRSEPGVLLNALIVAVSSVLWRLLNSLRLVEIGVLFVSGTSPKSGKLTTKKFFAPTAASVLKANDKLPIVVCGVLNGVKVLLWVGR